MQRNLTKGSIVHNILVFSLPYLMSSFLQTFYGMADIFITGKYNKSDTITAVSVGSQFMHMVTLIIAGLAMGTTVITSQAVGEENEEKQGKCIGNTISLFIMVSIGLTILLLLLSNNIVNIMLTPEESVAETRSYLIICFLGIPFITAYNVISSIFRGLGDSRSPMIFVAVSCVFNIALDFLFIGKFHMGASGAAFGTVAAQTISVILAFIFICIKGFGIRIKKDYLRPDKLMLKTLLRIGTPVSCQDGLIQVSFLIITAIANSRGVDEAAGVGITEKIISFMFLVPSAMLSAVSAIAAQNNGAGEHERAAKTLKTAMLISVIFGTVCAIICQFFGRNIISLFSDEQQVITMGSQYLKSYCFDAAIAGIHFCFSGYFCAYNKSLLSFIHNIVAIILVRVPGAYLASVIWQDNLYPMGMAAPLGSLLSSVICIIMYICIFSEKKERKSAFTH